MSVAIVARVADSAILPQPRQSSLAFAMPAVHSRMQVRRRFTHKQAAPGSGPSSRRRLQGKQPPPDRSSMLRTAVQAQAHGLECADDTLQPLGPKVRRNHVHYTHVRTRNPAHRQPHSFTRQEFYEHIDTCYRLAYPDPDTLTGSILIFGGVAKERHAKAFGTHLRDEHHNCITFCSAQHYWEKVVRVSRENFQVYLNAVAHTGYTEMWQYLKDATPKKPLHELDAEMYLSPLHPRGQELANLLEAGARSRACRTGHQSALGRGHGRGKRARVDSVFDLIRTQNIHTAEDFESFASTEAAAGRLAVAELCTRAGHNLTRTIQNARRVIDAARLADERTMSLVDKLLRAARDLPCECGGAWAVGAAQILLNNGIDRRVFSAAIIRALKMGAKRGVNIGLVGRAGSGKSTLLQPLEKVFKTASKPQQNSSFPLSNTVHCDLLLWQDYKHHEQTVSFTDILSFLVGESVDVRVPGERNIKVCNAAPMFYSGRAPISSSFSEPAARLEYDGMMMERFTTFFFTVPISMDERRPDHPQCAKCCAQFYLHYGSS